VATLGGLTGHVRGVCLPLGYALGQMLVTVKSVFLGEFGALGWLFIGGYAAVAIAVTLALVVATALVRRLWRAGQARGNRH
jgi:Na+/serine symporter